MSTWSFYDATTGLFADLRYSGPEEWVAQNVPSGCLCLQGAYDHLSQRVDVATGAIVDYVPPAPEDTDLATYTWDATVRRWLPSPTLSARKLAARKLVLAAIDAQEALQARPLREVAGAQIAGVQAPQAAIDRLASIEGAIEAMRLLLNEITAAETADALSAVELPTQGG